MASIYDRTINLIESVLTEVDMNFLYPDNKVSVVSSLPAWFIDNEDLLFFSTYWEITPPIESTFTYTIAIYDKKGLTFIENSTLTLIVTNAFEEVANCCSDENINIVWINRQGGRGNFIFTQRKDITVKVGQENTFITNDIIKRSEIKGVYNGKIVYTTGLTQTMVDFLDTFRYGIQAWQFNSDNTFTPILLDIGSFTKYTTKDKLYEIQLSFIYAQQLNIQRQ
jgi:hypothetical protein